MRPWPTARPLPRVFEEQQGKWWRRVFVMISPVAGSTWISVSASSSTAQIPLAGSTVKAPAASASAVVLSNWPLPRS